MFLCPTFIPFKHVLMSAVTRYHDGTEVIQQPNCVLICSLAQLVLVASETVKDVQKQNDGEP